MNTTERRPRRNYLGDKGMVPFLEVSCKLLSLLYVGLIH